MVVKQGGKLTIKSRRHTTHRGGEFKAEVSVAVGLWAASGERRWDSGRLGMGQEGQRGAMRLEGPHNSKATLASATPLRQKRPHLAKRGENGVLLWSADS